MSKQFKTQDWFEYKKLGTRWRKPKGRHSKLRIKKKGSGRHVGIGYRTARALRKRIIPISNMNDILNAKGDVLISSTVGLKMRKKMEEKIKELGFKVLNKKKAKKLSKITKIKGVNLSDKKALNEVGKKLAAEVSKKLAEKDKTNKEVKEVKDTNKETKDTNKETKDANKEIKDSSKEIKIDKTEVEEVKK